MQRSTAGRGGLVELDRALLRCQDLGESSIGTRMPMEACSS
jgi:hypothetical protein